MYVCKDWNVSSHLHFDGPSMLKGAVRPINVATGITYSSTTGKANLGNDVELYGARGYKLKQINKNGSGFNTVWNFTHKSASPNHLLHDGHAIASYGFERTCFP